MDDIINHINTNWKFYTIVIAILGAAGLFWLSKYFATKKDLEAHTISVRERFDTNEAKFTKHQLEHYKLRDMVNELDGHVKYLPTAQDSQALRESMARLEGRLESVEPMFKQILNQYNMLVENELRGEKK
tara:strand:- start:850 stop:1239 length:390 start_codon:yes stop_codon:yes gene_type:complete